MSSILIQDVSKTFETKDGSVQALNHVSLSIETGDIYGIIGMSGAGKSTLVRCMNFLEVPSEGKVLIDGKSLSEFSPKELRKEREKIGMIFQHFNPAHAEKRTGKRLLPTVHSGEEKKPKQEQKPWSFWKS